MIENLTKRRELKQERLREILKEILIENEVLNEDGVFGKNANDSELLDRCIKKAIKKHRKEKLKEK